MRFKKLLSGILCFSMIFSFGFASSAAESQPGRYFLTPKNAQEKASVTPARYTKLTDTRPRLELVDGPAVPYNNIGEPQDSLEFYSLNLRPIIQDDSGELIVLEGCEFNFNKNVADYISRLYTKAETTAMYNKIFSYGHPMAGWEIRVTYRFAFIQPTTWSYGLDGVESVTESVPLPHNPYQLYQFTYYVLLDDHPYDFYTTNFCGHVNYYDKYNHTNKSKAFKATTSFNIGN